LAAVAAPRDEGSEFFQQILGQDDVSGSVCARLWMAPDLSCFALGVTIHAKQPDGTWKLMIEKQAVSDRHESGAATN
jgi:hypothetical protein